MKRSYHTDLLIQYKLGILPMEVIKQIPTSTLDNWKKRDINHYYGLDNIRDYDKNLKMIRDFMSKKNLLKAAKALYYIYQSYVKLFDGVKNKKKLLRQTCQTIVKTIDHVKDTIGQNRALKAFGISCQQYYAWKRNRKCRILPSNPCRKIHHNQITFNEVETIREYLANILYRHHFFKQHG